MTFKVDTMAGFNYIFSMKDDDTWGHDPQVRYMRGVFAAIENAQKEFLDALDFSPMDGRLRRFRQTALRSFERSWIYAVRKDIEVDASLAVAIYILCLARAMSADGIDVPRECLPADPKLAMLVEEALG